MITRFTFSMKNWGIAHNREQNVIKLKFENVKNSKSTIEMTADDFVNVLHGEYEGVTTQTEGDKLTIDIPEFDAVVKINQDDVQDILGYFNNNGTDELRDKIQEDIK